MVKYQGITTLEVLEDAKNYNNWIVNQFLHHLKSPILEIGSGTGNISKFFISKPNVYLSDIDNGLIKHLRQKFPREKTQIIHLNIEKECPKKLQNYFKSIIGINVLEHIKDDKKALQNIHRLLTKNGQLLLLVPAKKIAYTKLDKRLGHFRRYEKSELQEKLVKSGFVIEELYSFNFIGLISWIARNQIEHGNHLNRHQVILFDMIVPILRIFERIKRPFVGVSLIVRARKVS